jgi:hypothetical protein
LFFERVGREKVAMAQRRQRRAEMKADNIAMWAAITNLNNEVSTGRGAVKALVWVGSVILATAGLVAAFLNAMKN